MTEAITMNTETTIISGGGWGSTPEPEAKQLQSLENKAITGTHLSGKATEKDAEEDGSEKS
jgi:hypothetical protein